MNCCVSTSILRVRVRVIISQLFYVCGQYDYPYIQVEKTQSVTYSADLAFS